MRTAIIVASKGRPQELGRWIDHIARQTVQPLIAVLSVSSKDDLPAVAAAFSVGGRMNYQALTNDSLTMMYEAVRGALLADDEFHRHGGEARFRVRETPEWKTHAADLESEMLKRGMIFEVIDWSEG